MSPKISKFRQYVTYANHDVQQPAKRARSKAMAKCIHACIDRDRRRFNFSYNQPRESALQPLHAEEDCNYDIKSVVLQMH